MEYETPTGRRNAYTPEQDAHLKQLVNVYGTKVWSRIAQLQHEQFPEIVRSGKQLRERWCNHLGTV